MKHIIAVLIGLILLSNLSGCATVGPTLFTPKDTFDFNFKVTSDPDNADVYVNDRLFGRTPCAFSLTISFNVQPYIGRFSYYPKENYVVRVSKDGYKDAVKQIIFYSNSGSGGPSLMPEGFIAVQEDAYNFVLEKK